MIQIKNNIWIDKHELFFSASRSGGPGGQNVNKLSTKVTVKFNVPDSPSLSESQKQKIRQRLANRIDRGGNLSVSCQRYRTQLANKHGVIDRFVQLIKAALTDKPQRKPTTVTGSARRKRLEEKRKRGEIKRLRAKRISDYQ